MTWSIALSLLFCAVSLLNLVGGCGMVLGRPWAIPRDRPYNPRSARLIGTASILLGIMLLLAAAGRLVDDSGTLGLVLNGLTVMLAVVAGVIAMLAILRHHQRTDP